MLGSLLEKERTVPASYPMTLNGLRTACNQSSSREPVVRLRRPDQFTERPGPGLKARGLARMVYAGSGARAVKYRQVLDEKLGLEPDQRALITVLLLRGPQAPGELKTRTERLHGFADRAEVEVCLAGLASEPARTMVRELERLPGQQGQPVDPPARSGVDSRASGSGRRSREPRSRPRGTVLADGPQASRHKVVDVRRPRRRLRDQLIE